MHTTINQSVHNCKRVTAMVLSEKTRHGDKQMANNASCDKQLIVFLLNQKYQNRTRQNARHDPTTPKQLTVQRAKTNAGRSKQESREKCARNSKFCGWATMAKKAIAGLSFFDAGRVSFGTKTEKAPGSVSAVARRGLGLIN